MRLRQLNLTRYGKFTDKVLDFGARADGVADLHIIYGPNEAGKSTTFSAFLDLLFGIGIKSPYDFVHPYPTMRIGGTLELAGGERSCTRIKRPQNSLLDLNDQPIPESAILGEIGGIDREAYRTMFSLDDETLEAGGKSILQSRGDLGQLLFSASAGLSELSERLGSIRTQTESFYKFRARSGELAALKDRLAELRKEREAIDTLAPDYRRHVDTAEQAGRAYDEAISERSKLLQRLEAIRRMLATLPRHSELAIIRQEMAELADLKPAPDRWRQDLPALARQDITLATRREALEKQSGDIHAAIDALPLDDVVLALAPDIAQLSGPRARHMTAEKDLPERRTQLAELDKAIARLLHRLDCDAGINPSRLILNAATIGTFRELTERRSGIDTALSSSRTELAKAQESLARAHAVMPADAAQNPPSPADIALLRSAIAAARSLDFTARRQLAERALKSEREKTEEKFAALRPWSGDAASLGAIDPPDADRTAQLKSALSEAEKVLQRRTDDVERLITEVTLVAAEIDAFAANAMMVTDQQAANARQARDAAWTGHRRRLDADSADLFESELRKDDTISSSRLVHMRMLADMAAKRQTLAVRQAELQRSRELLQGAETTLETVRHAIQTLVAGISPVFKSNTGLGQIEVWLERRREALSAARDLRAAERHLEDMRADELAAASRLREALGPVHHGASGDRPLDTTIFEAQAIVDRQSQIAASLATLEGLQKDVRQREDGVKRAQAELDAWDDAWRDACLTTWLGERNEVPGLAAMREIVALLGELGPALDTHANLTDRIAKMSRDQSDFQSLVSDLARRLGMESDDNPSIIASRTETRLAKASAARHSREEAILRLERSREELRSLTDAITVHDRQKAEMTGFFDVETLDEVGEELKKLDRRDELQARASLIEREILDNLRQADIAQAQALLDGIDRPSLELEQGELEPRLSDMDGRIQDLYAEKRRTEAVLAGVGGDGKVAEIEERRRTLLLEIEDGATRYLKLRLGVVAAEHALRAYRDQHRSSMMRKASEAFAVISRGAYGGLATQPGKDGETLIALAAAGGSKNADDLSKGTRFQLYLALRVAGYHEFVRASGPVPFIADDIMETFDDFRAEEAFRLFADMAVDGQVIYLTHHRHLCDIARIACPTARIHEL